MSLASLHPAISHFPIALLAVLPLLTLAALLSPSRRAHLTEVAVCLLGVAVIAVLVSAATGDAARDIAPKAPSVTQAIESHETLGSIVRGAALVLLVVALFAHLAPKRQLLSARAHTTLLFALLIGSIAALVPLYFAAHSGVVLVHTLGVHAKL